MDISIGVLPVSGSLNPDQNMYPGFAPMLDEAGFFNSIEPVASAKGKKFDLLLQAGPAGFAPEVKVMSGYSGKVLWHGKVNGLYGSLGRGFARTLAKAFSVGSPAYQEVIAEREVYRRQKGETQAAGSAPDVLAQAVAHSDVDSPSYKAAENPDDFALVVGVEKYTGLPPAQFAERDAEAILSHLTALGYPRRNISMLIGQQASKAGMAKNIETWLPRNVNEKSSVFFYFSG
ncbi:MAG: caspase family protein, partial [candidate division NC10 bacterium]